MMMTFVFPNYDTLRFALTGGAVPPDVGLAPARAGVDADGRPWVTPELTPAPGLQNALRQFGVRGETNEPSDGAVVAHWPQVFPLRRDAAPSTLTDQTPVLFELPPDQLGGLVAEMLRLGNDRQGYRWLETAGSPTLLLRVVGPPYYSLLRALDFRGEPAGGIRAYVARAPRVWVQLGYSHPLADLLQAPEGQLVVLRAPADWVYLDEAPFTDVYDVAEFRLPGGMTDWADAPPAGKLSVPLQLAAAATTDPAELWVLNKDGLSQIDALVREADDKLLARLAFAIGDVGGRKTAVLRARPVRTAAGQTAEATPSLSLGALAYRPYLRLPNLFLPVGTRLRPPLRRDAVRELLANDPAKVTWLVPHEDGSFVAHSLPDDAFRPLADWVEYVLATEGERLAAWLQAARFDFGSFIGKEDLVPAKTTAARGRRRDVTPRPESSRGALERSSAPLEDSGRSVASPAAIQVAPSAEPVETRAPATPSELQVRLRQAERRFLDADGPLDAPQRQALWPELARLNTELGQTTDAAACWLNAMWEPRGAQATSLAAWAWGWVRSEKALLQADLSATDLDRLMADPQPTGPDLRPLAAALIWASAQKPTPPALRQRLSAVQRYLEQHDRLLPVRAAWLAWVGLTRLAGADVLSLARTRDRLLERLLSEGLSPERDLPGFLRFAGQREADRLRVVREKAERLRQLAQEWFPASVTPGIGVADQTPAYMDLLFAFGMARLGEASAARDRLRQAGIALGAADYEAHHFLLQAFQFRVETVLAGRPHAGPLPPEQLEYLEQMRRDEAQIPIEDVVRRNGSYSVERFRRESRILDPQEAFDPYRHIKLEPDEIVREMVRLTDVRDRREIAARVPALIQQAGRGSRTPEVRLRILSDALALAPRAGEALAVDLLMRVGPALDALTDGRDPSVLKQQAVLLEQALVCAAHFDRSDFLPAFTSRLLGLMTGSVSGEVLEAIAAVVGQSLRSLRKLGLRDETERLLDKLAGAVLRGQSVEEVKVRDARSWPEVLRILLHLASGWMESDGADHARAILDEARRFVASEGRRVSARDWQTYVSVVEGYLSAARHLPPQEALARIEDVLSPGRMNRLPNTLTTNGYYSRFHLQVIEAAVLALASEEFALGPAARRWLDDDEYLVRRRIHADVRASLNQAGM
jgi:hypothetical protein